MHLFLKYFVAILLWQSLSFAETYDLPLFLINTKGGSIPQDPKVDAVLHVVDQGVNSPADSVNGFSTKIGIEIRGQTSANFDKKSYGIETRDSIGGSMDVALVGLPEGDDWVLHGPFIDKTLIRNALAHFLYQSTGRYSPRSRFVEVFLNNEYQGVYLLLEKIKRSKNRQNLTKLTKADTTGDAITGSYIFRIDKSDNIHAEGFLSSDNLQIVYHYPKKEDMMPQQETYLQGAVNKFENLMDASHWNDPNTGYSTLLDVDAAVDYVMHEEITKNTDAYICSFYMFKQRDSEGGKISLGPPWDFNLAFGAVNYSGGMETNGWQIELNISAGSYKVPPWLLKLWGDTAFQDRFKARWAELRSSVWHSSYIDAYMDSLSVLLANASERNFDRWPILGSASCVNLGTGGFSYNFCFNGYSEPTWEQEITHVRTWFKERIAWIDSELGFVEPATPVVPTLLSEFQNGVGEAPSYHIVGESLVLNSAKGGRLVLRNLEGQIVWSGNVAAGVVSVQLPRGLHGTLWVASLHGAKASFVFRKR